MATDAPAATTSRDSATPPPPAIASWVENRIDLGVIVALMGVLVISMTALGVCLWLVLGREAVPVYLGGG